MQTFDAAAFFESHLPVVQRVIAEVARRHRVSGDVVAEFRSLVFLKLVENDFAALRRFHGASSLRTYLTVIAQRVLLDYRNREWGRWRASAAAIRIGPLAVRLERLITRDGLSPAEAMAAMGIDPSSGACAGFAATLKGRSAVKGSRTTLGEDAIPECLDPAPGPEALADLRDQEARAGRMRRLVRDALRTLDSEDHLIITLRFRDGLSVADVGRVLRLDAKPLYRRIERILAHLHRVVCADAGSGAVARELARGTWCDLLPAGESGWWRQSNSVSDTARVLPDDVRRGDLSRRRPARRVHRRLGGDAVRPGGTAPV